jgi:hypothetical protein
MILVARARPVENLRDPTLRHVAPSTYQPPRLLRRARTSERRDYGVAHRVLPRAFLHGLGRRVVPVLEERLDDSIRVVPILAEGL